MLRKEPWAAVEETTKDEASEWAARGAPAETLGDGGGPSAAVGDLEQLVPAFGHGPDEDQWDRRLVGACAPMWSAAARQRTSLQVAQGELSMQKMAARLASRSRAERSSRADAVRLEEDKPADQRAGVPDALPSERLAPPALMAAERERPANCVLTEKGDERRVGAGAPAEAAGRCWKPWLWSPPAAPLAAEVGPGPTVATMAASKAAPPAAGLRSASGSRIQPSPRPWSPSAAPSAAEVGPGPTAEARAASLAGLQRAELGVDDSSCFLPHGNQGRDRGLASQGLTLRPAASEKCLADFGAGSAGTNAQSVARSSRKQDPGIASPVLPGSPEISDDMRAGAHQLVAEAGRTARDLGAAEAGAGMLETAASEAVGTTSKDQRCARADNHEPTTPSRGHLALDHRDQASPIPETPWTRPPQTQYPRMPMRRHDLTPEYGIREAVVSLQSESETATCYVGWEMFRADAGDITASVSLRHGLLSSHNPDAPRDLGSSPALPGDLPLGPESPGAKLVPSLSLADIAEDPSGRAATARRLTSEIEANEIGERVARALEEETRVASGTAAANEDEAEEEPKPSALDVEEACQRPRAVHSERCHGMQNGGGRGGLVRPTAGGPHSAAAGGPAAAASQQAMARPPAMMETAVTGPARAPRTHRSVPYVPSTPPPTVVPCQQPRLRSSPAASSIVLPQTIVPNDTVPVFTLEGHGFPGWHVARSRSTGIMYLAETGVHGNERALTAAEAEYYEPLLRGVEQEQSQQRAIPAQPTEQGVPAVGALTTAVVALANAFNRPWPPSVSSAPSQATMQEAPRWPGPELQHQPDEWSRNPPGAVPEVTQGLQSPTTQGGQVPSHAAPDGPATLETGQQAVEGQSSRLEAARPQSLREPPAHAGARQAPAEAKATTPAALKEATRATTPAALNETSSGEEDSESTKAKGKKKQAKRKRKEKMKKSEREQRGGEKVKKKSKAAVAAQARSKPETKALSAASGSQSGDGPDLDQAIQYIAHLTLVKKDTVSRLVVMARGPSSRKQQVSVERAGSVMKAARIAAVLSGALHEGKTATEVAVLRERLFGQPPQRPVIKWTEASRSLMETLGEADLDGVTFVSESSTASAAEELADDDMMTSMDAQIKALSKLPQHALEEASAASNPDLPEITIGSKSYDRCAVETAIEESRMSARQACK